MEFSAWQQLVWEMRGGREHLTPAAAPPHAAAAAAADRAGSPAGRAGAGAGVEVARASGLMVDAMMTWHARTWTASYTRVQDVTMAAVSAYDYAPSRREKARQAERVRAAAAARGGGLQMEVSGFGAAPAAMDPTWRS